MEILWKIWYASLVVLCFVIAVTYSRHVQCLEDASICVCAVVLKRGFSVSASLHCVWQGLERLSMSSEGISTTVWVQRDVNIVVLVMLWLRGVLYCTWSSMYTSWIYCTLLYVPPCDDGQRSSDFIKSSALFHYVYKDKRTFKWYYFAFW